VDVVGAIEAMRDGRGKVFFAMGGNFATATPDTEATMPRCALRPDRARGHQAQPQPPGARQGRADPALPGPHRDRPAGRRPAGGDGGGLDEHGPPVGGHQRAGIARIAVGTGDRRAARAGHAGQAQRHAVALAGGRLRRIRDQIARVFEDFHDFNQRVRVPGGFRLATPPRFGNGRPRPARRTSSRTDWPRTRSAAPGDAPARNCSRCTTVRSHDQYNTTIYGLDDRYRGVHGERRVLFAHADDIAGLGFAAGQRVDIESVHDDGVQRIVRGFLLAAYDIPRGCLAAYYPETNPLVPLDSFAIEARTPTSKAIPVILHAHDAAAAHAQPRDIAATLVGKKREKPALSARKPPQ
jgi:hypothetical protein